MNKTRTTLNRSEDAELLIRFIRDNDNRSFEKIVRKYESLVWSVCCRLLDNRCDAEDAFQATFMLLASRARRIRKPRSLSSWLYGVAFRTASSIRKRRHRDLLPYVESIDQKQDVDVLEQVAKKNENELVSAELMLLKDRYKIPVLMYYFLGKSCHEIADVLGLSVAAVESRLRRARKSLKHRLRLRGINLAESCAALAVPVLAISPNLIASTVNNVTAASVASGLGSWASSFYSTLQPTGAKLMLFKTLITCGMIGLLSIGLVSHGDGGFGGMTVVDGEGVSCALPIKFVADEDEDNSEVNSLVWWHDHIHGLWQGIWEGDGKQQQPEYLKFDVGENEMFSVRVRLVDEAEPQTVEQVIEYRIDESLEGSEVTFDLQLDDDNVNGEDEQRVWFVRSAELENKRSNGILSGIPLIGRFFDEKQMDDQQPNLFRFSIEEDQSLNDN